MATNAKQPKGRGDVISSLNVTIEALNLAKEISTITPAKAAFGSISALLAMIRDSMANERDYVELGLNCGDICRALDRGINGKKLDDLSKSVCDAIAQLTITVAEIQGKVIKRSGRNAASRLFHAKNDKEMIAVWGLDLNRILQVFNTELAINTHITVSNIHRDVSKIQEEIGSRIPLAQTSKLGESPPPQPRVCFGRGGLVEEIVGLAENLTPIALIGAGGIGKTSIALTVLHHDKIRKQFGDNRWFIRCDQFPASHTNFLSQLSKVIGAGIENPEDLAPLRPFLSSRNMIIILDNAESILDPQGIDAHEIYTTVEELSQFDNICLCITSRISTIPPACETLDIPVLSVEAACDTFYRIYKNSSGQSNLINDILGQLDFHPLSITLLATVAHQNKWDTNQLAREWKEQRTDVLHTKHHNSLATTIELSLTSPMFQELGPDAQGLLGIIAFFPQGIDENNLDWLFPTTSNRANIFDNFCILSLAYRSNGFITMLAPLQDYLCPKEPVLSPLLCATKDHYFRRLSVDINPGWPGYEEAQWITSEDVNVEHLLNVFTSIDASSADVWSVCCHFMRHLYWHKKRLVMLGPKIEGLPDDYPSKPQCLFRLSRLFEGVGNYVEYKRLLTCTLKIHQEQGNHSLVAETLRFISGANNLLGLCKEGIQQAKEALEFYILSNNTSGQGHTWQELAALFLQDNQLDAAEDATSKVIDLLSATSDQYPVCECYRILGVISNLKGKTVEAINHLKTALKIAATFNWHTKQFYIHCSLAGLLFDESKFSDAHTHVEHAKSYAVNDTYSLGYAVKLQATFWYKQFRFKEAKSEALHAVKLYEKIGATEDAEKCRTLLQNIEEAMSELTASHE